MKFVVIMITLLLFIGCQYDPYADDATTNKPEKRDIPGVYYFQKQTILDKPINYVNSTYIKINTDGTYEAVNIPNVFGDTRCKPLAPISAKGRWRRDTVAFVQRLMGSKPQYGVRLTNTIDALSTIGFMGDKPPYQMIITYDDPDLGAVMIFKRRNKR